MKKVSNSSGKRTLLKVNDALVNALECGRLENSLYEQLLDLGLYDARPEASAPDLAWDFFNKSQAPVVDIAALKESAAAEVESVAGELPPPEEPPVTDEVPATIVAPTEEDPVEAEEIPPMDECDIPDEIDLNQPAETPSASVVETSTSPCHVTPLTNPVDDSGSHPTTATNQQEVPKEDMRTWSHVFTWCRSCLRIDACVSKTRLLPGKVGGKSGERDGIALIRCRNCKSKESRIRESKPKSVRGGFYGSLNTSTPAVPKAEHFIINAKAWRGTEVSEIAKALTGREVPMMTDEDGATAQCEVHELFQSLKLGERAFSIDVERFRKGERSGFELPYVEGGLW